MDKQKFPHNVISASFDSRLDAQRCIDGLKSSGVSDDAISIIAQDDSGHLQANVGGELDHDQSDNKGTGMLKGAAAGGAVGAIFGIAAFVIPGLGPFITAGWLATSLGAAGAATAAGAIIGATAGSISALLMNYGVSESDARLYEDQVRQGGVILLVDASKVTNPDAIRSVFSFHGGRGSAYVG